MSESVQQVIKAQNSEIFKTLGETKPENKVQEKGYWMDPMKPSKLESFLSFMTQLLFILIIIPLLVAFALISFKVLRIAIEIYKNS